MNLLINLELGEMKIRAISKKWDMNYPYLSRVMQHLETEGIINKIRQGRCVNISLTDKGNRIVECLKKLKQTIEEV